MAEYKIKFHQNFLDVFTKEELKDLVEHAGVVVDTHIIISTIDKYFELNAEIGDKLYIFCSDHASAESKSITKEEFMKAYKSSPIKKMDCIVLDEEVS